MLQIYNFHIIDLWAMCFSNLHMANIFNINRKGTHIQYILLDNGMHNNAHEGVKEYGTNVLPTRFVKERFSSRRFSARFYTTNIVVQCYKYTCNWTCCLQIEKHIYEIYKLLSQYTWHKVFTYLNHQSD